MDFRFRGNDKNDVMLTMIVRAFIICGLII